MIIRTRSFIFPLLVILLSIPMAHCQEQSGLTIPYLNTKASAFIAYVHDLRIIANEQSDEFQRRAIYDLHDIASADYDQIDMVRVLLIIYKRVPCGRATIQPFLKEQLQGAINLIDIDVDSLNQQLTVVLAPKSPAATKIATSMKTDLQELRTKMDSLRGVL